MSITPTRRRRQPAEDFLAESVDRRLVSRAQPAPQKAGRKAEPFLEDGERQQRIVIVLMVHTRYPEKEAAQKENVDLRAAGSAT
jgi:hypothetical protein